MPCVMPLLLPWSFYHGATKLLRKQKFYLRAIAAVAGPAGFFSTASQQ